MKTLYQIIITISLLSSCSDSFSNKKNPEAISGKLNLLNSNWDINKDGPIKLNGEWKFYPSLLIKTAKENSDSDFIKVPGNWKGHKRIQCPEENCPAMNRHGYATYCLDLINKSFSNLSLKLPNQEASFALHVNGAELIHNGIVNTKRETYKPDYKTGILRLPSIESNQIEICIQVANFDTRAGGLRNPIYLGTDSDIQNMKERSISIDLFLAGSMFVMALYHIGFYYLRRTEVSFLYFSLFCFLMGLRTLLTGERYFYEAFPFFPWALAFKMDYLTFYLGIITFVNFVTEIFKEDDHPKITFSLNLVFYIFSAGVVFTPSSIFTYTLEYAHIFSILTIIYIAYILIKSVYKKRYFSVFFLIGASISVILVVNDILFANQIINTGQYAHFGFFSFIFFQAFLLSTRFARSFNQVEELSKDLKHLNENLEQEVLARTIELQQTVAEIEVLNEITRQINETNDIRPSLVKMFEYIGKNFGLKDSFLYLTNKKSLKLELLKASNVSSYPPELREFLYSNSIELDAKKFPYITRVFRTKKRLYLENIPELVNLKTMERRFTRMLNFSSLLVIPLVIEGEVIGILVASTGQENRIISSEEMVSIQRFCEHIAASINTTLLLYELQREKEVADKAKIEADEERKKSDELLLNVLPRAVADELKSKGYVEPIHFNSVSVLFTDFKDFTQIASSMSPDELIKELDGYFVQFDKIVETYELEKLKTIGDSYMCVGGAPRKNTTHPVDCVLAALEIQAFMEQTKQIKSELGISYWELRIGIHTGPLVAGVIGKKKFTYDVWGDTVNMASRMESSSSPGKINISEYTYEIVKDFFDCEYRGKVQAKNKGEVDMYYVLQIKSELSVKGEGKMPNSKFYEKYSII